MNSSSRESPHQKRNLNESKNITILPPEITSTPFVSKTKVSSPLITPTRKFLGPRRYALSNNGMLNPVKTIKDPPGPLLASTAYNVNVSTYIDTKSPGYVGRLVQYNEEQKQQNTHQERYGSPGLLPIVHLFKKEVPVISPKIKKGTVRIGTPESRGYYSQEHSRLLLEGIVQNNSILKEQNNSNEVSTRSVLDALKEISRKRIHVNEEYDPLDDNNKKFRKDNGEGDYSKRNRIESPPSEKANSPSTTQAKKRLCTIDAVLASKTSSMYSSYEMGNKRKSSEDSNTRVFSSNKKKFNNVETQTPGTPVIVREMKRTSITKEKVDETVQKPVEKTEEIEEISSESKPVLKVLDDKPLEVMRKNRLGALLSALSGREIPSIPLEDRRKALDQEWPSMNAEKTLVSILSPQSKQTKTVEKHVTFNIPQSTQSSESNDIRENGNTSSEKEDKKNEKDANTTSISLLENGKTVTENKFTSSIKTTDVSNALFTKLDTSQTKEEKQNVVGGFKFDLTKPIDSKSNATDNPQANKTESRANSENQGVNSASPSSTSFKPMFGTLSTNSEIGGPSTKSTLETSFTKSPSTAPALNSLGLPTSLPSNSSGMIGTSGSFTFEAKSASVAASGSKDINEKATTPFTFGNREKGGLENPTNVTGSISTESSALGRIGGSDIKTSTFGSKTISSPSFAFNGGIGVSTNSTINSNNPVASSSKTTFSSSPSFSTPSSVSTVPSVSASILPSKSFDMAGSTTAKAGFGTSNSSPGGFKFNSGNSLPSFSSPSANSIVSSSTNVFGSPANVVASSAKLQAETTTKTFGSTPTSSSSMFGSNSLPNSALAKDSKPFAFGSNNDKNASGSLTSKTTPGFTFNAVQTGIATTSAGSAMSSNLSFGSTVPSVDNPSNMFSSGKNPDVPSFGASTTEKSFGTTKPFAFGASSATSLTTPSSTTSLFTSNTPSFGTSTTSFGTTNTPSFGNANTPSFGTTSAPTNTSSFGNSNTQSFGTKNAPSFGTTNALSFGSTNTPSFGNTNTPSFGTTTTPNFGTTNTLSFGTTSAPSFGTTNAPSFGTTSAPSFGTTSAPSFGTTSTPSFGATNTPNFGSTAAFSTTNTPSFSSSSTLTFNSTNSPSFGMGSTPFGSTNTSNFNSTKDTLFGGNNPPGFGTANPSSFPTNNTSSGTNTFGVTSASASSFGTPKSTAFGTTNTPTFGNAISTSSFGTSFSSSSTLSAPSFGNPSAAFGNAVTSNTNTFNANNTSSPFSNTSASNSFGNFNANSNNQFSTVTTASAFGTNTNTFGNSSGTNAFATSTTNNAFGSSNASSPFGTNMNSTGSNAFSSGFGKKPEQSSSVFPAPTNNMFNSNTTFGSGQSNNNGGTIGNSSSGVFTFGSSNSNAASSAGVFTFGGPEPPKTFNFNSAGTAGNVPTPSGGGFNSAPSFGAPSAPNMFSIGSGNTAAVSQPRGRPLVRARRRT